MEVLYRMIRTLKNLFHLFVAFCACCYYRFPGVKMTVIGVTGTDGKTTTVHLVYEILRNAGIKASMVSTVAAIINGKTFDSGLHVTTPSPWRLQKFMHQAKEGGSKYFVLEATSHALDQHRIFGSSIDIALVTNISHEHLDYHDTFERYRNAKAKILKGANYAVLNKDDSSFNFLKKKISKKLVTYSLEKEADYTLGNIKLRPKLLGEYNLYNCLAAATVTAIVGIDQKVISETISKFSGVPGRMQKIKTDSTFSVFIDFAHKPNALDQTLKTARSITNGKLIVVFGCAGLRDRLKRPMMGEIAAKLADYIILTAEDPRTEDVRDIIGQIAEGCTRRNIRQADKRKDPKKYLSTKQKYFWRIADRQEAINFAIRKLAQPNDTILIIGKGHEKSMCYGKIEYPWDEKKAVEKALSLS